MILENIIINLLVSLINKKWAGKNIEFCGKIYSNIYFEAKCTRICCHSTILPYNPPVLYKGNPSSFSKLRYVISLFFLMFKNTTIFSPCKGCKHFKKQTVPVFNPVKNLNFITLNQFKNCNSYCVYCSIDEKSRQEYTPIFKTIEKLYTLGLISSDVLFNWGGGEPTLCPEFEDIIKFLYTKMYRQAVNSSGIIFSKTVLEGMKKNLISIQISPDAGDEKTYKKIKKQNNFSLVWENIKKYSEYPDELFVKYIIFSMNSEPENIEKFVEKCKLANVKNIVIDCEFNSMNGNYSLFGKISNKETAAAKLLKKLAESAGMNVLISHQWDEKTLKKIKK